MNPQTTPAELEELRNEKLPAIHIRSEISAWKFILQVETLRVDGCQVERRLDLWSENEKSYWLEISPVFSPLHVNLRASLRSRPETPCVTRVELYADTWADGNYPRYETYAGAAKEIFDPLLKRHREKFGQKCHMRIQSRNALKATLPSQTKFYFERFSSAAKGFMGTDDWIRFDHFISAAHQGGTRVVRNDLLRLLNTAGFGVVESRNLAARYEHGRDILAHRRLPRRRKSCG